MILMTLWFEFFWFKY